MLMLLLLATWYLLFELELYMNEKRRDETRRISLLLVRSLALCLDVGWIMATVVAQLVGPKCKSIGLMNEWLTEWVSDCWRDADYATYFSPTSCQLIDIESTKWMPLDRWVSAPPPPRMRGEWGEWIIVIIKTTKKVYFAGLPSIWIIKIIMKL